MSVTNSWLPSHTPISRINTQHTWKTKISFCEEWSWKSPDILEHHLRRSLVESCLLPK